MTDIYQGFNDISRSCTEKVYINFWKDKRGVKAKSPKQILLYFYGEQFNPHYYYGGGAHTHAYLDIHPEVEEGIKATQRETSFNPIVVEKAYLDHMQIFIDGKNYTRYIVEDIREKISCLDKSCGLTEEQIQNLLDRFAYQLGGAIRSAEREIMYPAEEHPINFLYANNIIPPVDLKRLKNVEPDDEIRWGESNFLGLNLPEEVEFFKIPGKTSPVVEHVVEFKWPTDKGYFADTTEEYDVFGGGRIRYRIEIRY
jgi:hypothetical protein